MATMSIDSNGNYVTTIDYNKTLNLSMSSGFFSRNIIITRRYPKASITPVSSTYFTVGTGGFVRTIQGSTVSSTFSNSSFPTTYNNTWTYSSDNNYIYMKITLNTKDKLINSSAITLKPPSYNYAYEATMSSSSVSFNTPGYVEANSIGLSFGYTTTGVTSILGYDNSSTNTHKYKVLNDHGKIRLYISGPDSGSEWTDVTSGQTFQCRYYTSTHTVYRYNMPSLTYYDRDLYFYVNGSQVASKSASSSSGYPSDFNFGIYTSYRTINSGVLYVQKV